MTDFRNDAGTGVVTADGFVGLGADDLPVATETTYGAVKMSDFVAAAAGANPTKAEFDGLLTKLIAAGIMAAA